VFLVVCLLWGKRQVKMLCVCTDVRCTCVCVCLCVLCSVYHTHTVCTTHTYTHPDFEGYFVDQLTPPPFPPHPQTHTYTHISQECRSSSLRGVLQKFWIPKMENTRQVGGRKKCSNCNILHTHCNTLQYFATHCRKLQDCNTL